MRCPRTSSRANLAAASGYVDAWYDAAALALTRGTSATSMAAVSASSAAVVATGWRWRAALPDLRCSLGVTWRAHARDAWMASWGVMKTASRPRFSWA